MNVKHRGSLGWVVELPWLPAPRNQLDGRKWALRNEKTKWNSRLGVLVGRGPVARGRAVGKCRVRVHTKRWNRQDPDNLVASVKPILDVLGPKWLGWIEDDRAECLELEVTEECCRKRPRPQDLTRIEWERAVEAAREE